VIFLIRAKLFCFTISLRKQFYNRNSITKTGCAISIEILKTVVALSNLKCLILKELKTNYLIFFKHLYCIGLSPDFILKIMMIKWSFFSFICFIQFFWSINNWRNAKNQSSSNLIILLSMKLAALKIRQKIVGTFLLLKCTTHTHTHTHARAHTFFTWFLLFNNYCISFYCTL